MKPISERAVRIFGLISANTGVIGSIHINVLMRIANEPKSAVEVALIELMTAEYIRYDVTSQHIFLTSRYKRSRRQGAKT